MTIFVLRFGGQLVHLDMATRFSTPSPERPGFESGHPKRSLWFSVKPILRKTTFCPSGLILGKMANFWLLLRVGQKCPPGMWWPQVPLRMLRREVSATQHRLVMVARYLPQNGPKTQKFDFLARMPIKNIFETSFQTSASRLSKWRARFFWVIFLRLDSTLTMCGRSGGRVRRPVIPSLPVSQNSNGWPYICCIYLHQHQACIYTFQ